MILFLEKTWPLWWIFAVIIILRWFSATSFDPHVEAPAHEFPRDRQSSEGPNRTFVPKAS
ncbi:MAG TPA: hypothetical protein VF753_17800 [Terriglobales bacterium]